MTSRSSSTEANPRPLVHVGHMRSDYVIDASRIVAPTFLYYGSEEGSDPELGRALASYGVPHVLEGRHDHFTAFSDVASAAPVVLAFLDREYATNRAGTGTN